VQGQQHENNWHWQVSLPHGLNNQSHYLEAEALFPEKIEANLSAIHWQLLPDWLIEGIDGELTQAKNFSVIIEQLNWQHKKEKLALENAQVSCNLDWLKLQYSPQLRSQQALSQLPLACLNCRWHVTGKLKINKLIGINGRFHHCFLRVSLILVLSTLTTLSSPLP